MQHGSILDLPDEPVAPVHVRATTEFDAATLAAVRDALLAGAGTDDARVLLDPFAPVTARNAAVLATLRAAIAAQRVSGGVLAALSGDPTTLLAAYAATLGWGVAQRYLDDPRVDEVKINGTTIMVQEAGRGFYTAPEMFDTPDEPRARVIQLASALGVQLDAAHPQETLPVAGGTRVHATIFPRIAAANGALICIRRGRTSAWTLADLLERGTLDAATFDLLRALCRARCSMLIAGRTGSGKTGLIEALANTWPGGPHILTIEDHALELGIADRARWTRELVDTQRDPAAFGRAAREALRQTPGLVVPGETRGNEAGAILALAMSGHPVLTTLHARNATEAFARFAGYAAQPGAYMYEGRRDDALADTLAAFDVAITIELFEHLGRRLITQVALVVPDGSVRTLVELTKATDAGGTWQHHGQIRSGQLCWNEPGIDTRPDLARRLVRPPDQVIIYNRDDDVVFDRARRLLASGEYRRVVHVLADVWRTRRDLRALNLAHSALAHDRALEQELVALGSGNWNYCNELAAERQWLAAQRVLSTLEADLGIFAALPITAVEDLMRRVNTGLVTSQRINLLLCEADTSLASGDARQAIKQLTDLDTDSCDTGTTTRIREVRERALTLLVERGEADAAALPNGASSLRAASDATEAI